MTTTPVEWVMAAASVATGLFVGWQSYTLNSSLNAPFEANLHERQIGVCAEAIKATEAYLGGIEAARQPDGGFTFQSFTPPAGFTLGAGPGTVPPTAEETFAAWQEITRDAFTEVVAASDKRAEDFRRAMAELKVYASEATAKKIDEVTRAASAPLGFGTVLSATGGANPDIKPALEGIRTRCRALMLGQEKGLI